MNSETWAGDMIELGGRKFVPFSRVLRWVAPGGKFGLVWNRPSSVLVMDSDGNETTLPVVDVTRIAQLTILAGGALAALMILLFYRKR